MNKHITFVQKDSGFKIIAALCFGVYLKFRMTFFSLQQVIQEAKFEAKYGVNVKVDPDTGEVSVTKQPKNEIDGMENSSRKKLKKRDAETKSSKKEWKKQKLKEMKKEKLEKNQDDFARFQDKVKFGEIVHAPPVIKTLPRKADTKDAKDRVRVTHIMNKLSFQYSLSILKIPEILKFEFFCVQN